jgi:O-antigen ligase
MNKIAINKFPLFFIPLISFYFYMNDIFRGVFVLKEWALLISIAFVAFLFLAAFKDRKFVLLKGDLFLIAFMLFIAVSGFNFSALLTIALMFYYFILSNEIKDNSKIVMLFLALITISGAQALIGQLQNYGIDLTGLSGFYKIAGSFGSPIFFVAVITPAIPLTLSLYYSSKNKFVQNYAIATGAVIVLALSAANNRGSWLAALTGVAFFYALKYSPDIMHFFRDNLYKKIGAALLTVILLAGTVSALYTIRPVSADARLLMWKVGFDAFLEHPASGIGYGNMQHEYMEYQADFFADEKNIAPYIKVVGNVDHIHNEYIQLLAETGIIGFGLFAVFILALFYLSLKLIFQQRLQEREKYYLSGALSAVLSVLVIAFFGYYFYFAYIAVIAFALFAVISAILNRSGRPLISFSLNRYVRNILLIISLLAFVFIAKSAYEDVSARKTWKNAFTLALSGLKRPAIKAYKSIYTRMENNGEYLFNLGALYVSIDSLNKGISLLQRARDTYSNPKLYIALGRGYEKSGNYQKAVENYQRASAMMPHQMFPHYLLAKLHRKAGKTELSLIEAKKVIDMPVRVKSPAVFEMKEEMKKLVKK